MKKHQTTLRRRLVLLISLFLVLQIGVFSLLFTKGGVISTAQSTALNTLDSLTNNRCLSLTNEILGRWGNLSDAQSDISAEIYLQLQQAGATADQLGQNIPLAQTVVAACSGNVIDLLRQNGVTDAFLVLDAPGGTFYQAGNAGFAVRDYDPQSHTSSNTDLLLECGLPTVARDAGIPLDSGWTALFELPDGSEFYSWPMSRAQEASFALRRSGNFSYWSFSPLFDKRVLTCTVPLVLPNGEVVGILGVGILSEYITTVLHYEELNSNRQGAYVLGVTSDNGVTYQPIVTAGSAFSGFFRTGDLLSPQPSGKGDYLTLCSTLHPDQAVVASVCALDINPASMIQDDGSEFALLGLTAESLLFASARSLQQALVFSVILTFLISMIATLFATQAMTKPITQLVKTLERHDNRSPIRLPALGIREIDALSSAIENQNQTAIEAASRNSQVIAMTGLPLGVFDYVQGGDSVFVSRQLFPLLDWKNPPPGEDDPLIPMAQFQAWWDLSFRDYLIDQESQVFRIPLEREEERFVQLFYRQEGERMLGVYLDVTKSIERRKKIEYERDYDVLTNLLNRRAFDEQMELLFQQPEILKTAALIMFDLDNMKYANDTYGHDGGDAYLQSFARGLDAFRTYPSVIGRRSGDEFTVFLYGFNNQSEIRNAVNTVGQSLSSLSVTFAGRTPLKIRTSGGIAWYPTHSSDYAELLRMADFAMYDIKRTVKGVIREFDPGEYGKRGIFIHGQDALNRLIDERMVRYAFQPIVSAKDGSLFGYELLMRPQLPELANLNDLFRLAQSQSKLYQLEYLTWFESLATCAHYRQNGQLRPDAHLFINSIGSQCLTARDTTRLESKYAQLLPQVVLEVTELDEISFPHADFKRSFVDRWNGQIALDDYGTGFSSESVLIRIQPNLVKIDLSIIRNVDTDIDRQALVQNLVSFSARRDIRVLAEGVETPGEMATLIALGVDYLQGYYVARPNFIPQPIAPAVTAEILALAGATPVDPVGAGAE